jgi:putative salt-induced outer membrane protein
MKISSKMLVWIAALAITVLSAGADTIVLKNGDRLTGMITGSDGKTVTIKTEFAGEIKGPWSAIREVTSTATLYVVTPDKKTVNGTITVETTDTAAELIVHTASAGDVHVPIDKLSIIRSQDAETAYEKSLHPALTAAWKGDVTVGFSLARGNSETTNLDLGFNATRKTLHDQILLSESSIYSTNDGPGGGVTANEDLGSARYDHDFSNKGLFGFVSGDYTHDELQGLNLRSIYTSGLGWHAIHSDATTLDVLAGENYTRESYSPTADTTTTVGQNRNLAGATVGEYFKHELGSITALTEDFNFYPDLTNTGQYRFALDAGAETKISKWLGWTVTLSDRYVSDPPIEGTKANDVIFSTGLTASFGH